MKTYKIDDTTHIIVTDFTGIDEHIKFQLYNGIIESVDFSALAFSIGKNIKDVEGWLLKKEQERKTNIEISKRNKYTRDQKREMLYEEERKKEIIWMESEFGDKELRDYY